MRNSSIRYTPDLPASSWSNRILLLATAGILFLTMYPFRFSFHSLLAGASPFLLGKSLKRASSLGTFLNVLLFIPFGFGLAEKLKDRGKSVRFILTTALATGALFSYTIEFLQLYIPERDSGWEDVITNGSGSLVGSIIFLFVGPSLVRVLNSARKIPLSLLTPTRLIFTLLVYFCFWLTVAPLLQKQARLDNWNTDGVLVLGNDAVGQSPWQGQIQSLQIWNHAVEEETGSLQNAAGHDLSGNAPPLISYDFSTARNIASSTELAPKLFWVPGVPPHIDPPSGLSLDGKSWVSTRAAVGELIEKVRKTNQFAIHIVCAPGHIAGVSGRIVSISDSSGIADLTIHQVDENLLFWFRTPLSVRHAFLTWYVPDVFNDGRTRDVLYSYDGSNLRLTLDGKQRRLIFKLGPGTALAKVIRKIKPEELEGYNYIFYILVFFPAGAIIGFFLPRTNATTTGVAILGFLAFSSAAVILEIILVHVSGRPFSFEYPILSILLGPTGFRWAKADETFAGHGDVR